LEQRSFKIRDERAPAFGDDAMTFRFESLTTPSRPPGYFGLSSPPTLSVRQYGVASSPPARSVSSAACAAIQAKMPVVIGHAMVVPCFVASAVRSSFTVVTLP
jgi:hypothetical protein